MIILPAVDLFQGKAVRLFKGDYSKMTVYSDDPLSIARDFESQGAGYIHIVDLEGARTGDTPNIETVKEIISGTSLFSEVGGGIRDIGTVERYLDAGVDRVIIGTAAVTDPGFLKKAVERFGKRIAVGADIKDGYIAIKGWTENSAFTAEEFFKKMISVGVGTVICTDISKDGAMMGTNLSLYRKLMSEYDINIVASGGISGIDDIVKLREIQLYGAIIGKAYYTGAIKLKEAIEAAR